MTVTWILLLLVSCQQVDEYSFHKPCKGKYHCCIQVQQISQTQRNDTCKLLNETNASLECPTVCEIERNGESREQAVKIKYNPHYCKGKTTENCKCVLSCDDNIYQCTFCEPDGDQHPHGKHKGDSSWSKATSGIVIGVVVVGVAVVLIVTFRKKIKCSRGDQNNQSQRNTKRNSGRLDEEGVSGRSVYTSPSDRDSCTGMYSLQRDRIVVERNYRPLGESRTKTSPHFQLQPSIHRPFEDENEEEIYNEINDEDIKCFPGRRVSHNATSHQAREVTPSFLEKECDEEGRDGGYYKKLDRQTVRNKPTDCMSAAEENCQCLHCPTQPSGGYELAKAITDAHVNSTIAQEESSNNNAPSDNTPSNNIPYDHNPYDNPFSDSYPENKISENHNPEDNAVCAPYDNISSENNPHDKSLPDNIAHHENTEHNISDDKTLHEGTHLDHAVHEPCP